MLATFATADAGAATRAAFPNGTSASATCSTVEDNCSLARAVEVSVADADEIRVHPGTHALSVPLVVKAGVELFGQSALNKPRITGSAPGGPLVTIADGSDYLENLSIENRAADGIGVRIGTPAPAEMTRIDARGGATGLDITGATSVRASMATGGIAGIGLSVATATAALRNVTAVGGTRGIESTGAGTVALDSTIARSLDGLADIRATDGNVTATHSNYATRSISGDATIDDPATNSNQTAAPQLIDMANADVFARDLNQRLASPTVDAGSGIVSFDIDDHSAIGTRDIGADERGDVDVVVTVSHGSLAFPAGTRTFDLTIKNDTFSTLPAGSWSA